MQNLKKQYKKVGEFMTEELMPNFKGYKLLA